MAAATGYTSQYGWQLYDTTGTTEDWTYGAQGAFGYTIEIGPVGGKFHMPYETGVVKEWTGHDGREGHGMREALLLAAESAANPGDHSVVEGNAQPGAVLKLSKKFDTFSSPVCTFAQGVFTSSPDSPVAPLNCVAPGERQSKPDKLEYTTVVPPSGHYEWHVPPSTRPFVFRHVTPGTLEDKAYDTQTWKAEDGDIRPDSQLNCPDDNKPCSAERSFSVTESGTQLQLDLSWTGPQDYDLELYKVAGDGKLEQVDTSGQPNGLPESITVPDAATGDYVARIVYFLTGADKVAPANNWQLDLQRFRKGPDKLETGREEYTLTCQTSDGQVLDTRQVYVERGQRVTEDLCSGSSSAAAPAQSVLDNRTDGAKGPSGKKTVSKRSACMSKAGKIRSKSKRKAAVRRCKKRYPTVAERRAAAKKKAAAKKRAAAKRKQRRS
jgi:hypothetical protein